MISLTALGLGGVAAAAAAGWQQLKNTWNYMSSFVFVKASYDYNLSTVITHHLKRTCWRVPSGLHYYASVRMKLRGRNADSIIPFRLPRNTSIYFHGKAILFVSFGDQTEIRSLRGTIDFDKFTSDAIDAFEQHAEAKSTRSSRFRIYKVIGVEKGFHGFDQKNAKVKNNSQAPEGDSIASDSNSRYPDVSIDKSFKYDRSEYMLMENEDPLDGLYFDDRVLSYFDQAKRWAEMGNWYQKRNIPWRRGWLLHGPGGTGKSSIAKAVAQKLGLPIYQYFLATLSDQEFMREWECMNTPCVVLFEDFDSIFKLREPLTEHKSLTFDCVLNMISGVSSANGVFLMVTTNHIENIDPAMGVAADLNGVSTRPGRIDSVIEVGYMNAHNRRLMADRVLSDWPQLRDDTVKQYADQAELTPIQWQEVLIQAALERMAHDEAQRESCENVVVLEDKRRGISVNQAQDRTG
jgi:hypothetical protein